MEDSQFINHECKGQNIDPIAFFWHLRFTGMESVVFFIEVACFVRKFSITALNHSWFLISIRLQNGQSYYIHDILIEGTRIVLLTYQI